MTGDRTPLQWLVPIGLGAAAMFLLDPSTGARRRARLRTRREGGAEEPRLPLLLLSGAAALAMALGLRLLTRADSAMAEIEFEEAAWARVE